MENTDYRTDCIQHHNSFGFTIGSNHTGLKHPQIGRLENSRREGPLMENTNYRTDWMQNPNLLWITNAAEM
jgi:hypothetical protein